MAGAFQTRQKSIFLDLFYTAEQGKADCQRGLGLGLNLCQSIASLHGGQITVSDHKPSGTVFRFTLPAIRSSELTSCVSGKWAHINNSLIYAGVPYSATYYRVRYATDAKQGAVLFCLCTTEEVKF